MGNTVPRMCYDVSTTVAADGTRSRRATVPRMCHDVSTTVAADGTRSRSAAARRRGGKVVRRRRGVEQEQQQQAGGGGGGVPVATVKVVLKRKEAERLIARLEEDHSARERHARIAELTCQLRAGDGGRNQETWRPRLKPIQENYS